MKKCADNRNHKPQYNDITKNSPCALQFLVRCHGSALRAIPNKEATTAAEQHDDNFDDVGRSGVYVGGLNEKSANNEPGDGATDYVGNSDCVSVRSVLKKDFGKASFRSLCFRLRSFQRVAVATIARLLVCLTTVSVLNPQ